MGRLGPADRLLARLEHDVDRALANRDRVVLAFSGGLGSLLLAAVTRKRADLRCIVVGFRHASDVEASRVASQFLDYRVEVLQPSPEDAVTVARAIHVSHTNLSPREILNVVPVSLVRRRCRGDLVLSGFGLTWPSVAMRDALLSDVGSTPCLRTRDCQTGPRGRLLRIAAGLGIPDAFALGARRSPAEGSGVGPAMRALARREGRSVARMLAGTPLDPRRGGR